MFKNEREQKFYESKGKLVKEHGPLLGRSIIKRINEIQAFNSVGELMNYGGGNPHFLKGNHDKCIGISLNGNFRIIIKPIFDETVDFSTLNLNSIEIVKIMEVDDYHG